jgi:hypothetical protein
VIRSARALVYVPIVLLAGERAVDWTPQFVSRSAGRCWCCRSVRSATVLAAAPRRRGRRAPFLPRAAGDGRNGVRAGERLDALALAGMALIAVGVAMARPRA